MAEKRRRFACIKTGADVVWEMVEGAWRQARRVSRNGRGRTRAQGLFEGVRIVHRYPRTGSGRSGKSGVVRWEEVRVREIESVRVEGSPSRIPKTTRATPVERACEIRQDGEGKKKTTTAKTITRNEGEKQEGRNTNQGEIDRDRAMSCADAGPVSSRLCRWREAKTTTAPRTGKASSCADAVLPVSVRVNEGRQSPESSRERHKSEFGRSSLARCSADSAKVEGGRREHGVEDGGREADGEEGKKKCSVKRGRPRASESGHQWTLQWVTVLGSVLGAGAQ